MKFFAVIALLVLTNLLTATFIGLKTKGEVISDSKKTVWALKKRLSGHLGFMDGLLKNLMRATHYRI
jgi:hypothetical protein